MNSFRVTSPYAQLFEKDGTALDNGKIYIGEKDEDPITNPIDIFSDNERTIPLSQPVRTLNGYPHLNGSPINIYTAGEYSETVLNSRDELIYYEPSGMAFSAETIRDLYQLNPNVLGAIDFTNKSTLIDFGVPERLRTARIKEGDSAGLYTWDESATEGINPDGNTGDGRWVSIDEIYFVTPRMFGAIGDGSADDRLAIQQAWDYAGLNNIPCRMEGLEYNCSEAINTSSNLTVLAEWATMYVTDWPLVGGFINNVKLNDPEGRVQENIYIEKLIVDGSKLPPPDPLENHNTNLLGFARGASHVRIVDCIGRRIRRGFGGGSGGGAFGVEQGGENIEFLRCIAEDCYRAFRVAGIPGDHADSAEESRRAINIKLTNFTARRCGTALLCHSIGHDGDNQSNLGIFDFLADGIYAEDCGHQPWSILDYNTHSSILPQKTGVIVLAGAQNCLIKNVRIKLNSGFPENFTDWLGNAGYPNGTTETNYVGQGLSGNVGAAIWGWGRNVTIDDVTLDGKVDAWWKCHRAVTFGEIASVSPTWSGSDGTVQQFHINNFKHVAGGTCKYIFDGQSGLDNSRMSCRLTKMTRYIALEEGVVGTEGTAELVNVSINLMSNNGAEQKGNAKEWLAYGNIPPTGPQKTFSLGGYDVAGGYASDGSRSGQTYDANSTILRCSKSVTTNASSFAFYNPNGLVGTIATSGSQTNYNTTSDKNLKKDFKDFDGLSIVLKTTVYDHAWKKGNGRSFSVKAQEAYHVHPNAVTVGDSDKEWEESKPEDRSPWSVDYSKYVPILIKAVQQLEGKIEALENDK